MKRFGWWFALLGIVSALLGGFTYRLLGIGITPLQPQVDLRPIVFSDLEGHPQSLNRWETQTLVINFWATWCPPCVEEMPELQRLNDALSARGVQVVGIAIDEPESVVEFLRRMPVSYPILVAEDDGTVLSREWGNVAGVLPFTVVISLEHRIVYRKIGLVDRNHLLAFLERLPAKSTAEPDSASGP